MTSLLPQSFIPGKRLQDGTDLNLALANPQWSTTMSLEATAGGTAATSIKIVNTLTNVTSAVANAGVTLPRAAIGRFFRITNSTANAIKVYAESDATINGAAGSTGYALPAGQTVNFYGIDTIAWQSSTESGAAGVAYVPDVAVALRAVTPTVGAFLDVGGYYAAGDGGGGQFYGVTGAAAGTYVDNGGTIIVPTGGNGSAAWLRNYDNAVNPSWFGAKGDGSTDDTAAIQAAINTGESVIFSPGFYRASNLKQSTNQQFISGEGRVRIHKNANGPLITCRGNYIAFENIDFVGTDLNTGANYTGSNILCFPASIARFTASMSGTNGVGTFTATGVTGTIAPGDKIYGDGVPINATVGSAVGGGVWNFTYNIIASYYQFTVSGVTSAPVGSVYTNNGKKYTITATNLVAGSGTITAFGKVAPTSSGTLTRSAGSGDATISFSAISCLNSLYVDPISLTNVEMQTSSASVLTNVLFQTCSSSQAGFRALISKGQTRIYGTNILGKWNSGNFPALPTPNRYDIEIGVPGLPTYYHQLIDVITDTNPGGIIFIDTGAHYIMGSEFGKLYLAETQTLPGASGGMTLANRLHGDVTVEKSAVIFSANQIFLSTIGFAEGTSGGTFDRSNYANQAIFYNNGNANNFIEANVSTGGVTQWRVGPSNAGSIFTIDQGSESFELPGSLIMQNNTPFYIRNAAGTGVALLSMTTGDNISFGANTGVTKSTFINSGGNGIQHNVGGTGITITQPTTHRPFTDNAVTSGVAAQRWSQVYGVNFRPGGGTPIWTSGAGTPEGNVTAVVGSLYTDTSGGGGTTLYVKETGSGSTGWVAK